MAIEIIISEDGSHTLFVPELNETYHSHHGALRESQYVFIEQGLDHIYKGQAEIRVFEVGFGTGLNAILTFIWASQRNVKIHYHTLEPYPIGPEIFEKLNYLDVLERKDLQDIFLKMHQAPAGTEVKAGEQFYFYRYQTRLEDFKDPLNADLIFYDAFAPNKQPSVWDLENFKKTAMLLGKNGVLVSYCASGQFKRNLKEAGYQVETLQGPPGKKEMTRGTLIQK